MKPTTPVHTAAAYFEPRLRVRIARALREVRASVNIDRLAQDIALGNVKPISEETIAKALAPASTVIRDAVRQGGKLGADVVNG